MPAMNGFDLLQLLRSSNLPGGKDLPVIAITARDMPEEEFTSHGFTGCLHKPFSRHDIVQIVSAVSEPDPTHETGNPPYMDSQEAGTGKDFPCMKSEFVPHEMGISPASVVNPPTADSTPSASGSEKQTSGFDWDGLTAYSDEDENGRHEILHVFYHSLRQDLEALQTAVRQEDLSQIAYLAHRQIPVFTLIRAGGCVRRMQYLEKQEAPFSDRHRQETLALIAEEEKVFRELQTKLQQ